MLSWYVKGRQYQDKKKVMLLKCERRTVFEKSEVQQFRSIDSQPTEDEKNEVSQEFIVRVSLNALRSIFTFKSF